MAARLKRVVVLHYSPIAATVVGEAPEIHAYLGSSRLGEVIDRNGADLVVHGHAHHGTLNGSTTGGIRVHNVAITLLQSQEPSSGLQDFRCLTAYPGLAGEIHCFPDCCEVPVPVLL